MKENNSFTENTHPKKHQRNTHSHTKSRKKRRRSSSSGRPSGHVIFVIVFSIILVVTIVRLFQYIHLSIQVKNCPDRGQKIQNNLRILKLPNP